MKTEPINTALQGLFRAKDRLNKAAGTVASGEVSADSLIETKLAARDVQVQMKSIQVISETESKLLDEIA